MDVELELACEAPFSSPPHELEYSTPTIECPPHTPSCFNRPNTLPSTGGVLKSAIIGKFHRAVELNSNADTGECCQICSSPGGCYDPLSHMPPRSLH